MKRENTRLTTVKLNWLESIKSNKLVSFLDYQVPGIYPRFFFIFHPVLEDSVRSPSDCCRDSLLLSFYFQTGNFSSNISRIVSKLWAIPSRFLRDSYEIPSRFFWAWHWKQHFSDSETPSPLQQTLPTSPHSSGSRLHSPQFPLAASAFSVVRVALRRILVGLAECCIR